MCGWPHANDEAAARAPGAGNKPRPSVLEQWQAKHTNTLQAIDRPDESLLERTGGCERDGCARRREHGCSGAQDA